MSVESTSNKSTKVINDDTKRHVTSSWDKTVRRDFQREHRHSHRRLLHAFLQHADHFADALVNLRISGARVQPSRRAVHIVLLATRHTSHVFHLQLGSHIPDLLDNFSVRPFLFGGCEMIFKCHEREGSSKNACQRLTFLAESDFHAIQHFGDNRAGYAYAADRFLLAVEVLDELLQVRQHGAICALGGEIAPLEREVTAGYSIRLELSLDRALCCLNQTKRYLVKNSIELLIKIPINQILYDSDTKDRN